MRRTIYVVVSCVMVVVIALTGSKQCATAAMTIDLVPVGNPGNANDPSDGDNLTPGVQNFGAVAYSYSIGKYDVTIGQYTTFLNSVAATDTYGLYNANMQRYLSPYGIARNGSMGSYSYSVIGSPNNPMTFETWGDAARFANWLANGQPTGPEGAGTAETGSYTLNGAMTSFELAAITRNANATWVIPTENEWYKAAYYNPSTSTYYKYPFSSNTVPTSTPPGNTPNSGNFHDPTTGYAINGDSNPSPLTNYLSDVGAYTASVSPYGAFDMGGDVLQWNESVFNNLVGRTDSRGLRGGSWYDYSQSLGSFYRDYVAASNEGSNVGFRVAFVPEPSTAMLAGIAGAMIFSIKRQRRLISSR